MPKHVTPLIAAATLTLLVGCGLERPPRPGATQPTGADASPSLSQGSAAASATPGEGSQSPSASSPTDSSTASASGGAAGGANQSESGTGDGGSEASTTQPTSKQSSSTQPTDSSDQPWDRFHGMQIPGSDPTLGGDGDPKVAVSDGHMLTNDRFGFAGWMPGTWNHADSENGDGFWAYHPDAVIRYSASNVDGDGSKVCSDMRKRLEGEGFTITYAPVPKVDCTFSGVKGPTIVYAVTIVGNAAQSGFEMRYPTSRKADYDVLVTKVRRSFEPGDLQHPH